MRRTVIPPYLVRIHWRPIAGRGMEERLAANWEIAERIADELSYSVLVDRLEIWTNPIPRRLVREVGTC